MLGGQTTWGSARRGCAIALTLVLIALGMAVGSSSAGGQAGPAPSGGRTDFDGDGLDDIFWYGPGSTADVLWTSTGDQFTPHGFDIVGDYLALPGNFRADASTDILWYAPGPSGDGLWTGDGASFQRTSLAIDGDYRPIVGDFDGDGFDSIVWYRPGPATERRWDADGTRFTARDFPSVSGDYHPVVGDFDGDGFDDIVWHSPGPATDSIWYGAEQGFDRAPIEIAGSFVAFSGDFDDDGLDDVFWYAPGTAVDSLWLSSGRSFEPTRFSIDGGYLPMVGDFDGVGGDDILWYAPGPAADSLWSNGPDFGRQSLAINGRYRPVGAAGVTLGPPVEPVPVPVPGTLIFAEALGIAVRLPSNHVPFIGFHESSDRTAGQLSVSSPVPWTTMPSRRRGTPSRSAADVVLPPGADVLAPVTGTVVVVRNYLLYGRYADTYLVFRPDGGGGYVKMLHVVGPTVSPGDRVVAGRTKVAASARRFGFDSQVDEFSGVPTYPHTHIEITPGTSTPY